MHDRKRNLGHDVLRGDKIDVVSRPDLLQLDEPLAQLFGREAEPFLLVRDVMVLAEGAAQVAHGEEDGSRAVMSLDAWLLAKVRRDNVDHDIGPDQTDAGLLIAVHAAEPRTEVAVAQVGVGPRPFQSSIS